MAMKITGEETKRTPLLSLKEASEPELASSYVDEQAVKLDLTLGQESPGKEVLSQSFVTGDSVYYKRLLAEKDRLRKIESRNDVLSSIMNSDPKAITPEVVDVVRGLTDDEIFSTDLDTIIEDKYSELYTNVATASLDNGIVQEAMDENPDEALDMMDRAQRVAFKKNLAATQASILQKEDENRSIVSKVWDFTERIIPFVEWYQKLNQVGKESDYVSSILPGNNLEEQYSYLWNLEDAQQFKREFTAAVEDLKSRNLSVAQSWIEGFNSYGSSDQYLDNLFAVADTASALPIGTLSKALKGVAKASHLNPVKVYKHSAELGKYGKAAIGKNIEEIENGTFLPTSIKRFDELENSVPSITSPLKLLEGSGNLPQAAYLRLKKAIMNNAELAKRFLIEPNLIDRSTVEELVQYEEILRQDYIRQHPSVQQNVIDVTVSKEADLGNVYQARVILGRRDGTLFESSKQAENYFKRFIKGTDDYEIEQVGEGFRIVIRKNVDESKFLSDLKLGTTQRTPDSLANAFGGWWRSPNYTVSRQNELARSTAVTSTESMTEIYEQLAAPWHRLSKSEKADLEDLMVQNREDQRFYETYGDFEQAFFLRHGRNPTLNQTEAYFSYIQMNDLDLMVRDLDWYKQKAIQGREELSINLNGEKVSFEGKVLDDLPTGSDAEFRWVLVEKGRPVGKPKSSRFWTQKNRDELNKLLEKGYKVLQVSDQALKIGKDQYTGFVVTKDFSRSRVGVKNVDRRPGGHKVDAYKGYVKQGKISQYPEKSLYRSDVTLFGVQTEKEGKEFVDLLNTAREKLLRGDPDAWKFIKDNLPISTKRFAAAIAEGIIDLNVPFAYTPKGIRTIDTGVYSGFKNLEDLGKSPFNLDAQIMGRYGGQRDMSNIQVIRSEGDQKFEIRGAEYLSPMDTLRMTGRDMISVRMMNDYTLQTHRNFLREFGDILEGTPEEIQSSGISYLMNPRFKSGADPQRVQLAKNVSLAYNNLMNHGTSLDRLLNSYKEKLLSSVYPKLGPRGKQWVDDRMLYSVKDPGVYFRSFAFNLKLGLFNPIQYFVQANSLVNVASIAGRDGLRGGLLYPIFRAALLSNEPSILKKASKIAENVGLMKAEDFEESMRLYKKSGFHVVGRDVAFLDDVRGPEISTSRTSQGVRRFLSWGKRPFQEGERLVRIAAWNAAYLEVKRAAQKAGRRLSRRDEAQILQRAKDLTGNMTRESNAGWQKGYAAVFTQFFGYQARIMEQFLGKKLTTAEKLRLFAGYSMAYGIPVATGAVTGVIPWRDVAYDTILDMGYDPEGTAVEPFMDGFASVATEFIFGDEKNVASRYGPGGLPTFYDFFRGDREFSETFLGASGAIALDTVKDAAPILNAMISEFSDHPGGLFNLRPEDFLQPLRNISSVDNAVKLWQVYNFGIWASRNEVNLVEMDLPDGIVAALTGLQPAEIEDAFNKLRSTQRWEKSIEEKQREFTKDLRRVMRMDPGPEREKEIRRIKALMRMTLPTFTDSNRVWRNAADEEMVTDKFFENYQEMVRQKRRLEN